jgi:transposase
MPKSHREYLKWTPERLLNWAAKTGPSVAELAQLIMESRAHPQQGFRSILGILRLSKQYGQERLEAACKRALAINAKSYKSVKSILKNGLDQRPLIKRETDSRPVKHPNIRGAQYYSTQKGEDNADTSHTGETKNHEALGHDESLGGADGHAGRQLPLI